MRERILEKLERLNERDQRELVGAGWVEWKLPRRPYGEEGGTVWLPPEWRLVGPGEGPARASERRGWMVPLRE